MKAFSEWVEDRMVDQMAGMLHDEWRRGRLKSGVHGSPDAVYEPRMKPSGLDDGKEIDIAQGYDMLTPKWQAENKAAARAALEVVTKEVDAGRKLSELATGGLLELLAAEVHEAWMKRNPKADYNAEQHVPYQQLPEVEKQKDRDHVLMAIKVIGKGVAR